MRNTFILFGRSVRTMYELEKLVHVVGAMKVIYICLGFWKGVGNKDSKYRWESAVLIQRKIPLTVKVWPKCYLKKQAQIEWGNGNKNKTS